jgi:hypothetical protein
MSGVWLHRQRQPWLRCGLVPSLPGAQWSPCLAGEQGELTSRRRSLPPRPQAWTGRAARGRVRRRACGRRGVAPADPGRRPREIPLHRGGRGLVAHPAFKAGRASQPDAWKVRFLRRLVPRRPATGRLDGRRAGRAAFGDNPSRLCAVLSRARQTECDEAAITPRSVGRPTVVSGVAAPPVQLRLERSAGVVERPVCQAGRQVPDICGAAEGNDSDAQ